VPLDWTLPQKTLSNRPSIFLAAILSENVTLTFWSYCGKSFQEGAEKGASMGLLSPPEAFFVEVAQWVKNGLIGN
jgi:hypothetical protein